MKGKRFSHAVSIFAAFFLFAGFLRAQDLEANLKIESVSPPVVRVEGKLLKEGTGKNWSFLRSIAGVENLGERISELSLQDNNGKDVSFKKLIAGEYLADDFALYFSYKVDLSPPKKLSSMAHLSWLASDQGLLMLDDLLPQMGDNVSARIKFETPKGWLIVVNESSRLSKSSGSYDVADIEKAVFFVGKNWRATSLPAENFYLRFIISGEFLFSDDEAMQSASEILKEYKKIFGSGPDKMVPVFLLKFPTGTKLGNWEAETRGSNIVILSSDMPFKNQSVQRLHEQLRHELFHLWIPNNLALAGNYDWFYEGFALYQSLRTGVQLNRIRFEDFLDTLARAYDLDSLQNPKVSLIEASKNRWSGANAQIYARGMLVAFLSDLALLETSKGKGSVSDILRALYQKHQKPNKSQDGNEAILQILETYAELRPIVERYIKGAEKINWQANLQSFGIESNGENFPTKLDVKSKLTSRQKDLLNDLGYNNWRKLLPKSK